MFKRMQWKIVCIFVALVLAIMLFVGIYMFGSIILLYSDDFRTQMDKVMSGSFTEVLSETLNGDLPEEARTTQINTVISAYSSQLGLSEHRQCAVLDARDASRIVTTGTGANALEKTPNIIQAMAGTVGRSIRSNAAYMDYAYFLEGRPGESGYIVYVRDNKQNANTLTRNMLYIIVQG